MERVLPVMPDGACRLVGLLGPAYGGAPAVGVALDLGPEGWSRACGCGRLA